MPYKNDIIVRLLNEGTDNACRPSIRCCSNNIAERLFLLCKPYTLRSIGEVACAGQPHVVNVYGERLVHQRGLQFFCDGIDWGRFEEKRYKNIEEEAKNVVQAMFIKKENFQTCTGRLRRLKKQHRSISTHSVIYLHMNTSPIDRIVSDVI